MGENNKTSGNVSTLDVVTFIEDKIACGQLVPGQRLVEPDLMAESGASRATVREALNFLAGHGVVELVPYRGGRIRKLEPDRLGDMLEVFWGLLRAAIETFCERPLSETGRSDLEAAMSRVEQAAAYGSDRERLEASFAYTDVIYRHCGNPYFSEALERLHIRHYLRQAPFEAFFGTGVELAQLYRNMTAALLKADAAVALGFLKPEIDRLAVHVRARA
jgi:DNA-binding GntR family transcriptional regulator